MPYEISTIFPETNHWSDVEVIDHDNAVATIQEHLPKLDAEHVLRTGEFVQGEEDNKTFH